MRYLTKSRFKLALECPAKMYYDGKPEYANQKVEDTFLLSLAEGGFQVGELAKYYFPGGHEVGTLDYDLAVQRTSELLELDQVVIYEAAFRFENLFIRVDVLNKVTNKVELIEVKAKSFNGESEEAFVTNKGKISSSWRPYLYDVAFQKYVLSHVFPKYSVKAYLMLADKNALCPTEGLNQKFKVVKDKSGRKHVVSEALTAEDLEKPILRQICVDSCCELIFSTELVCGTQTVGFAEYVNWLVDHYVRDQKIHTTPSSTCAKCEFQAAERDIKSGLKNGLQECWMESLGWTSEDFKSETVLDIWNFRKKDQCIKEERIKLADILQEDISPTNDGKPGISVSERQWLQVVKSRNKDLSIWLDANNLEREMSTWVYPLHFIDFETAMVAIPFNKGRRPYEGIAFQFSHHVIYEDGQIEHKGQYLNAEPGTFPNYDFLRNLKAQLEHDVGSIFRYAAHENTILNMIYSQLISDSSNIRDRDKLCSFVRTITKSVNGSSDLWEGPRNMIDMCELVKRYYYDPATKGSNSIKAVLPAMLNSSQYLQDKYSKRIYGADDGIFSFNFMDWKWIEFQDGIVMDPYKLLPKMFKDISDKDFALLSDSDELRDGGAALTAYSRLQFEEMSDYERLEIKKALLQYCELDTFAMVMIYEGWRDLVNSW